MEDPAIKQLEDALAAYVARLQALVARVKQLWPQQAGEVAKTLAGFGEELESYEEVFAEFERLGIE